MKRWLIALGLVVLVLFGAATGFVLYRKHESRNIHGSASVEFVTTGQKTEQIGLPTGVVWRMFGFDAQRTRAVDSAALAPPFRPFWVYKAGSLVEFPPAIAYARLFFTTNHGNFVALAARRAKLAWRIVTGRCTAASPAVANGIVYAVFMNRPPCNRSAGDGELLAVRTKTGTIVWKRVIGPSESSPLVAGGLVYAGDAKSVVWAFDARTGTVRWHTRLRGAVKGGPAYSGGRIFVGDYAAHVYALSAKTGRIEWQASAQQRLGHRGTFYSTPAVAYGRVYIGSTDGKVYSFGASSGKIRWSHGTGAYVYGSPAVSNERVYVGSYNGWFYAFDAATGDVRWRFKSAGPISGSATVLNGIVYFATLKRRTYALDARTGKLLWRWNDGKYTPVVTDGKRLYLVGYKKIYAMIEKRS